MITNFIIGCIAFILFEIFPTFIINIFGNENSIEYMEYAKYCLKIFLGGIIFTCLIKSMSILLQSMGASLKSTILALARDVIFFVPAIIILAELSQSVVTMLWSAIIADILSFITGIVLLRNELKKVEKLKVQSNEKNKFLTIKFKKFLTKKIFLCYNNTCNK